MNDKGKPQTTPNRTTPEHQTEKPNKDQRRTTGNSRAHQPVQEVSRAHHTVQTRQGIQDAKGHYQPNPQNNTSSSDTDTQAAPAAPLERGAGVGWAMVAGMEQHTTELLG